MLGPGRDYLHYKPGILAYTAAPALQSSFFSIFLEKKFCPKFSIIKNNLEFISNNYAIILSHHNTREYSIFFALYVTKNWSGI